MYLLYRTRINSLRFFFLAVVVVAFFLCWTPFHAQRLGYVYFKQSPTFRTINEYLMYASGVCYYLSSTINPIFYNVMSAKYRQAFRRTLCGIQNTLYNEGPMAGMFVIICYHLGFAYTMCINHVMSDA